jgi:hypothetical protein
MQINQPKVASQAAPAANTLWLSVGCAWRKIDKKGREQIDVLMGSSRQGQPPVTDIEFKAGDVIHLRINNKRPGAKDPDFLACVAQA